MREILDPKNGVFVYSSEDKSKVIPADVGDKDDYFKCFGKLLALQFVYWIPLDVYLEDVIFKQVFGFPLEIEDFKQVNQDFYNRIKDLKDNLNFDSLKEGGSEIKVTKENYEEYVNLLFEKEYLTDISKCELIKNEFYDVFPVELLEDWPLSHYIHSIRGLTEVPADYFKFQI